MKNGARHRVHGARSRGMKVQKKIVINALPEMVWPFLIEPDKILKWCITLESFEYTSPQKKGKHSTFRYIDKGAVHKVEVNCIITEWIENQIISFKMTSGTHFKSYEGTWMIESAQGKSTFSFEEKTKMPFGIIGKLVGIFSEKRAAAVVDNMLKRLKILVEKSI
jgi:uncharacterized protein YndB with AHSA1/START domain